MSNQQKIVLNNKSEAVKVCIRVRPLSSKEQAEGHACVVQMKRGSECFVQRPFVQEPPKQFTFDLCYDDRTSQTEIYQNTGAEIIANVLTGYNGTIFAYGQTGTGKTHTMTGVEGDPEHKGIMPRSFEDIFENIKGDSNQTQFLVRASYLEIYNEEIRDLLSKNPKNRLELHEKPDTGVYVKDLSYYAAKTAREIEDVMSIGIKNRSVGATAMNQHSSRSHSLFQITVERSEIGADGKQHIRVGKLNMVDLAGSERIAKTQAQGDRLKEAAKINLSLSSLCHVISSLTDPKATHIPYRDSKLTRLLQDSLGGNTKTVMIANIGPADYNYEETMNTLRYASRAKNIQNKPRINEDPKDALLREYQEELTKLREQLAALQDGADPSAIMAHMGGMDVVSGHSVVEKNVYVQDKQKMLEFEERLQREKEEFKIKAQEERQKIERNADLAQAEKERLIQELREKEQAEDKAKKAKEKMIRKLKKMEEKMVQGNQADEIIKKQKTQLKKTRKELQQELEQQAKLENALAVEEEEQAIVVEKFNSLAEELDYQNRRLDKIRMEYEEAANQLQCAEDDFDRERNDMYDTIYELTNQLKLKNMIIEYMIPPEEYRKYEKIAEWSEEINDWVISNPTQYKDIRTGSKRPQSAVGMKRPTSEYSRIAKGLGDLNPRYKFENILQLDLDMPERTTEDYQGVPSAKVQQAIGAILDDNDIKNESIPLSTLINFDDACLEEEVAVQETVPSNRPKSGKRPKSAKKKKPTTDLV